MTAKLDSSALIYLSKAGLLPLATQVWGELLITSGVYHEAVTKGRIAGHRDSVAIEAAVKQRLVTVVSLGASSQKQLNNAGFSTSLGVGEKETIIEALVEGCLAVLDDNKARATAVVLGSTFCRTEMLLVEALVRQRILVAEFEALLLRLAGVRNMKSEELAELLHLGRLIAEVSTDDHSSD